MSADAFHLPEPWNGDLRNAPLLFVSSNPAIGINEEYPTDSWNDEVIEDYFTHRFGGGQRPWTRDARPLNRDGTHGSRSPFWSAIRARARQLFQRDVVPGVDFALTEVVHCKSFKEEGVRQAADECAGRYLARVLEASGAVVIVGLGRIAEAYLRRLVPFSGSVSGAVSLGTRERRVAVLPHPNARKLRSFEQCLKGEELDVLRAAVKSTTCSKAPHRI